MRIIWTRGNLKKDLHFCRDYFKTVLSFPYINFETDGFNSPYRSLRGLRVNLECEPGPPGEELHSYECQIKSLNNILI